MENIVKTFVIMLKFEQQMHLEKHKKQLKKKTESTGGLIRNKVVDKITVNQVIQSNKHVEQNLEKNL